MLWFAIVVVSINFNFMMQFSMCLPLWHNKNRKRSNKPYQKCQVQGCYNIICVYCASPTITWTIKVRRTFTLLIPIWLEEFKHLFGFFSLYSTVWLNMWLNNAYFFAWRVLIHYLCDTFFSTLQLLICAIKVSFGCESIQQSLYFLLSHSLPTQKLIGKK